MLTYAWVGGYLPLKTAASHALRRSNDGPHESCNHAQNQCCDRVTMQALQTHVLLFCPHTAPGHEKGQKADDKGQKEHEKVQKGPVPMPCPLLAGLTYRSCSPAQSFMS
jgi:hypothetical protein